MWQRMGIILGISAVNYSQKSVLWLSYTTNKSFSIIYLLWHDSKGQYFVTPKLFIKPTQFNKDNTGNLAVETENFRVNLLWNWNHCRICMCIHTSLNHIYLAQNKVSRGEAGMQTEANVFIYCFRILCNWNLLPCQLFWEHK